MKPIEHMPGIALKGHETTELRDIVDKYADDIDQTVNDMLQTFKTRDTHGGPCS